MRCTAKVVKQTRCRNASCEGLCVVHKGGKQECPICLRLRDTRLSGWCRLRCGHGFCDVCLFRWNQTSDTCPLCRGPCFEDVMVEWKWVIPMLGVLCELYLAYRLGIAVGVQRGLS